MKAFPAWSCGGELNQTARRIGDSDTTAIPPLSPAEGSYKSSEDLVDLIAWGSINHTDFQGTSTQHLSQVKPYKMGCLDPNLLDTWDTKTCLLHALPGSKSHRKLLTPDTTHVQLPDPEANTLLILQGSGLGSQHLPGLSHHTGVWPLGDPWTPRKQEQRILALATVFSPQYSKMAAKQ